MHVYSSLLAQLARKTPLIMLQVECPDDVSGKLPQFTDVTVHLLFINAVQVNVLFQDGSQSPKLEKSIAICLARC